MLKPNAQIMTDARASMQGRTGVLIAASVVYCALTLGIGAIPVLGWIANLLISGPLTVGAAILYLNLARGTEPAVGQLFDGFRSFANALSAYLLVFLFVVLWALLLIVPGIIAALSYAQTFYILADNEKMDAFEAIRKSKAMMEGNKMKLFLLGCRFIGWFLLGIVTFGIAFLWVIPYAQATMARFYEDLRAQEVGSAA